MVQHYREYLLSSKSVLLEFGTLDLKGSFVYFVDIIHRDLLASNSLDTLG